MRPTSDLRLRRAREGPWGRLQAARSTPDFPRGADDANPTMKASTSRQNSSKLNRSRSRRKFQPKRTNRWKRSSGTTSLKRPPLKMTNRHADRAVMAPFSANTRFSTHFGRSDATRRNSLNHDGRFAGSWRGRPLFDPRVWEKARHGFDYGIVGW